MEIKVKIREINDIIANWMKEIMRKHNLSAHKWASMAETAPTNITRFLMYKKNTPRLETIIKLAAALNEELPIKYEIKK